MCLKLKPVSGKNYLSFYINKFKGFKKSTDFSNSTKKARGGSSNPVHCPFLISLNTLIFSTSNGFWS
jgi:hypothetical protein